MQLMRGLMSFKPMEIHGFSVRAGSRTGDNLISRGGVLCRHYYWSAKELNSQDDFNAAMEEVLIDFLRTARVGCGTKRAYVEEYGWGSSKEEIDSAWYEYQNARAKLSKMSEKSPEELLMILFNIEE